MFLTEDWKQRSTTEILRKRKRVRYRTYTEIN